MRCISRRIFSRRRFPITRSTGLSFEGRPEKAESVYENYYHYSEALRTIPGHRVLAINRAEKEKIIGVKISAPVEEIETYLKLKLGTAKRPATGKYIEEAARDAYKRLIAPSIENDLRNELTAKAQEDAIGVFGKNLTQLGCKLAVCDPTGKVLDATVIYPTDGPQKDIAGAKEELKELVRRWNVDVISVGNGTASRESEAVIVDFIREMAEEGRELRYVIVNEAGASVYSASALATEEFPEFDVGVRSAASIARRLQDPLAELVKIDPKSIGVGQYQHDMNQTRLSEALGGVVEDCVNRVGVDVNTASGALLSYISGINKTIAKNIVAYREVNGPFRNRRMLLKVPKLGPKAFEQSAGFLRIRGGADALDMTGVHPESYAAAKKLLATVGFGEEDIRNGRTGEIRKKLSSVNEKELARDLGIGEYTLRDIIEELEKPGRDPREQLDAPVLRSDILEMKDLKPGMVLKGTVRNVIDFGAFVDIGVHQDGLVHISQMSDRYIKHPLEAVSVGDVVTVKVLSVDEGRKRISLTMKGI